MGRIYISKKENNPDEITIPSNYGVLIHIINIIASTLLVSKFTLAIVLFTIKIVYKIFLPEVQTTNLESEVLNLLWEMIMPWTLLGVWMIFNAYKMLFVKHVLIVGYNIVELYRELSSQKLLLKSALSDVQKIELADGRYIFKIRYLKIYANGKIYKFGYGITEEDAEVVISKFISKRNLAATTIINTKDFN